MNEDIFWERAREKWEGTAVPFEGYDTLKKPRAKFVVWYYYTNSRAHIVADFEDEEEARDWIEHEADQHHTKASAYYIDWNDDYMEGDE